jgi:hypothetical protein
MGHYSEELKMASAETTIYLVTCEQCGQVWRRTSVIEGQTMECIFCGRAGRLSLGAKPSPAATGARHVEARLTR